TPARGRLGRRSGRRAQPLARPVAGRAHHQLRLPPLPAPGPGPAMRRGPRRRAVRGLAARRSPAVPAQPRDLRPDRPPGSGRTRPARGPAPPVARRSAREPSVAATTGALCDPYVAFLPDLLRRETI